jgi:penicillin amidase
MSKYLRRALVHHLGAPTPARRGRAEAPRPARRRLPRRLLRVGLVLLITAVLSGTFLAWWVEGQIDGGLPPLDGELRVDGLKEPVDVERDALGIPTLRGRNRVDVAFATGFVHGQDRFFQMDLLRRHAAGELSELVGAAALDEDRKMRLHRFRAMARRKLDLLGESAREVLAAYARGVEAGRGSSRSKPFEYLVLMIQPAPWREEDSLLVGLEMFRVLQLDSVQRESATGLVYDVLPGPLADFLSPVGSSWDAPLSGPAMPGPSFPGPEVLDLRQRPPSFDPLPKPPRKTGKGDWGLGLGVDLPPEVERVRPGSNNWAVAGRHTTHGGAIVANDMHLWLMAPGLWYRTAFVWPAANGRENRVDGVTLPGAPAMVVGSNTHVAWGFTNTEGDWADLVLLRPAAGGEGWYQTPDGPRAVERHREVIRVRGGAKEALDVEWTIWGPVLGKDHRGRRRALRWVAHEADAINLDLMRMEQARTVKDAVAVAHGAGIPAQNLVAADSRGEIAWTIAGRIPRRVGLDGRRPTCWAEKGGPRWDGWLGPQDYPQVVGPPGGRLWTANNRVVGAPDVGKVGLGNYDLGARAGQVRDGLAARDKVSEGDMLAIQLDDRAVFLERWQKLLLEVLRPAEEGSERAALRREVVYWGGRAAVDSIGYRLVRQFRQEVHDRVLDALTTPCRRADPNFHPVWLSPNIEGAVWQLVTRRPEHLVPPPHTSWEDLLQGAVEAMRKDAESHAWDFERSLRRHTWGRRNTVRVRHPFSSASPRLERWLRLDMPGRQLPGDPSNMPRIQSVSDGASQRMAVSPGREAEGYFHMPAGQSGHPRSSHYRDGHAAWANGRPAPFLPGPAQHALKLVPR